MITIDDVVRYLLYAVVAVVVVVVLGGLLYFGVNYMDNSINNATQTTTQVSGNNRINANHKSAKNANNNNNQQNN